MRLTSTFAGSPAKVLTSRKMGNRGTVPITDIRDRASRSRHRRGGPFLLSAVATLSFVAIPVLDGRPPSQVALLLSTAGLICTCWIGMRVARSRLQEAPLLGYFLCAAGLVSTAVKVPLGPDPRSSIPVPVSTAQYNYAIAVMVAAFSLALLAYLAVAAANTKIVTQWRQPSRHAERILIIITGLLVALRALMQWGFGLGVIGASPQVPLRGVFHYALTFGPLVSIASLSYRESSVDRRGLVRTSLVYAIVFGSLGLLGGSRGALPVALVAALTPAWIRPERSLHLSLLRSLVLIAGVSLFSIATQLRYGGQLALDSVSFVRGMLAAVYRLGGPDTLAPVMQYGTEWPLESLLFHMNYVLSVDVYNYDPGAAQGWAATIWGIGHLHSGIVGVLLLGCLVGFLGGVLEQAFHVFPSHAPGTRESVGILFFLLIQEGTVVPISKAFIVVLTFGFILNRVSAAR